MESRDCNKRLQKLPICRFCLSFWWWIPIVLLKISSLKFAPCLTAMLNKPLLKGPVLVWLYDLRLVLCVVSQNNSAFQHDRNEHTISLGSGWLYIHPYRHINAKIYRERERILYTSGNKHSRANGSCPKFLSPETVILSQKTTNTSANFRQVHKKKNSSHTLSWIMRGTNMWKNQTGKQDLDKGTPPGVCFSNLVHFRTGCFLLQWLREQVCPQRQQKKHHETGSVMRTLVLMAEI